MSEMKKIMFGVGVVALLAGCAFNPESMPLGQKDSMVYVDEGAPQSLATKENRAKVAVIATVGKSAGFKSVEDALDSTLNAKLSKFAFFEIVDRKSQQALIKDAMQSGAEDINVEGVEADFVIVARAASLDISKRSYTDKKGNVSYSYATDAVFDFKWISKETQKVIMTESMKPHVATSASEAQVIASLKDAAEEAASQFCAKIAVKYAPPARVLQTRGNGAAARISLGTNYGVGEGTTVCFYEIIDNSDVGGEKRDMSDIAKGVVKRVEEKTSWVKVDNAEEVNVRKGVYVRVLDEKRSGFGDVLKLGQ